MNNKLDSRIGTLALIGVFLSGCNEKIPKPLSHERDSPFVISNVESLPIHVGDLVTIEGVQSKTKTPRVLGIEVSSSYKYSGKRVKATGILTRIENQNVPDFSMNSIVEQKPYPEQAVEYVLHDPVSAELVHVTLIGD